MKSVLNYFVTLLVILFAGLVSHAEEFNELDYDTVVNAINSGDFEGRHQKIAGLGEYHVVFVGGFGNELAGNYFDGNKAALEYFGAHKVSVLKPSSLRSARDNLTWLAEKIRHLHAEGDGKPIILVGHSKGGLESVGLVINNPDLIENKIVKSVVAVQAPLSGCHLGSCSSKLFGWTRSVGVAQGMHSLSSGDIHSLISAPLEAMNPSTRQILSDKVFYITSNQNVRKSARIVRLGAAVLNFGFKSKGDGLVAESTMVIPGFGRVLGRLIGDHMEFVLPPSRKGTWMGLSTSTLQGNWAFSYLLGKFLVRKFRDTESRARQCMNVYAN